LDHFLIGVDAAHRDVFANRLERGIVNDASTRMQATRRSQAVDYEINLTEVRFDEVDGFLLDLIGEGITVDAPGVDARFLGFLMKRRRVVPTCGARLALSAFLLEEHADSGGAGAKGGSDARSQTVAGGRADDQHFLGSADRAL